MQLHEMLVAMRIELQDTGTSQLWDDDELTRAMQKTVSLMSRFMPKRAILETVLYREISAETLTISSDTGTLTYKPIKEGSVSVTGKTEDTDYEVNLLTGVVTEIGSGLPDTTYSTDYELDSRILDISSLLPEESYVIIDRVEYPPGTMVTFEVFGEFIRISGNKDLADDEHLRIIYMKPWTAPVAATDGDYPEHLDNPVIIGSSGQALIFKAEKYVQSAVTELALVNAAADSMATPLADINTALDKIDTQVTSAGTALDKVATYLETNGTTDNAKDVLANITDNVADLRTAINTALTESGEFLTDSFAPAAYQYLVDGDNFINKSNTGQNVAENYSEYAKAAVSVYTALVQEAQTRLSNIRSYIEEANGWMKMGETFIAEGAQRLKAADAFAAEAQMRVGEVNAWAVQANIYATTSKEYLNIAGRYLASGQAKINEFLITVGIKPELYTYKAGIEQFS